VYQWLFSFLLYFHSFLFKNVHCTLQFLFMHSVLVKISGYDVLGFIKKKLVLRIVLGIRYSFVVTVLLACHRSVNKTRTVLIPVVRSGYDVLGIWDKHCRCHRVLRKLNLIIYNTHKIVLRHYFTMQLNFLSLCRRNINKSYLELTKLNLCVFKGTVSRDIVLSYG
jgi:hypothetical protein